MFRQFRKAPSGKTHLRLRLRLRLRLQPPGRTRGLNQPAEFLIQSAV